MASTSRGGRRFESNTRLPSSGTGTFRLNSELLEELKEEAGQKRTSLNTLVSQVLQSHAEYHTFAAKAGMISMPKNLLIRLMDKISEQELTALSEYIAKNELKDAILLMKNTYAPDSIMHFIDAWSRAGGYPYRHHVEGSDNGKRKHIFVLQHDMGNRWSLFFVRLFKSAFENVDVNVEFQQTSNTITFEAEF